jgi:hypothetical protein
MREISEIDKKATITLFCLMLAIDNMDELKEHEVYKHVFKMGIKNTAKKLTSHYDKMLDMILKANNAGIELTDSYVTFCRVIEDSFEFGKLKENEEDA